jgi:hypothetical protein
MTSHARVGNNQGFTVGGDQSGDLISMCSSLLTGAIRGPLMLGLHPPGGATTTRPKCKRRLRQDANQMKI